MSQKGSPKEQASSGTRPSRAPKPRKFYYTEQIVNDLETEWETEEQCGLNQPDARQMTAEELETMELEREGTFIFENVLRRRAGWTARKPRGLSSDFIFIAPFGKMEELVEGITKFTGYKAIAIKCRELGMDNFMKRYVGSDEDTESEEEEDSVAVSESDDEDDGDKKPRAVARRPASATTSLLGRKRASGRKRKVRFDSRAKKDSTLNLKRSPSASPSRKSTQKKRKSTAKRSQSHAAGLNVARSSMAVASSVRSPDTLSRINTSSSGRSSNRVTPPSLTAVAAAGMTSTLAQNEAGGERKALFHRVNDLDEFFLGAPHGGPLGQRVAALVEEAGLEKHESILINRVVALENLRQRVLAAEQSVYGSVQTGIVREATSILETIEQDVLVSKSSNSKALARVEQLELQIGIRASFGI